MIDDRCATARLGGPAARARSRPPRRRHRPPALAGRDARRVPTRPARPTRSSSPRCSTRPTGCPGRFTIGPLTEVAAQHHTWADLSPVLDRGPRAAFVAHERVLRGEVDRPTAPTFRRCSTSRSTLQIVGAGRTRSPTYTDAGAEFPMPRPADADSDRDRDRRRRRGATRRRCRPRRPPARRAVAGQLERSSRRRLRRGRRRPRRSVRSVSAAPGSPRSTRRRRWRGSHGPARAAAPTAAGEGRRPGGSAPGGCSPRIGDLVDEWPVPPDELGALAAELALVPVGRPRADGRLVAAARRRRRGQRHRLGDQRPRRRLSESSHEGRASVRHVRAPMHDLAGSVGADQPRAWRAARSCGSTLCTSPTMPRSAMPKIGASLSLLIAMMFFEPFMPTMCCVAPEMPAAM